MRCSPGSATPGGLESFYVRDARFTSGDGVVRRPEEQYQPGDRYHFDYVHSYSHGGEVLAVEPGRLVAFTFGPCNVEISFPNCCGSEGYGHRGRSTSDRLPDRGPGAGVVASQLSKLLDLLHDQPAIGARRRPRRPRLRRPRMERLGQYRLEPGRLIWGGAPPALGRSPPLIS